ncbi:MAG: hypothetical protein Q8880_05910 [Bacteroidota bacterium]|nr:hypothetical protein [Bacteroidota bacterium]
MNQEIRILGLAVNNRIEDAGRVQSILTKFGCSIKTRLGMHEVTDKECSTTGMMILELTGDTNEWVKLENELLKLNSVQVQKMNFRK